MAYSCIVQCCGNTRTNVKFSDEFISFFRLPKVDAMREDWLKRIGKVKMPANHQQARICSVHFTEESFVNPASAEIQTAASNKRRRRLAPHAVPTLYLTEDTNPRVRARWDFKIIRKEFVLHTQGSMSKNRPPDAEEMSCEQDKLNASASNQSPEIDPLAMTPTLLEEVSDQFATPTGENTKHEVKAVATIPRRLKRRARCRKRHHDIDTNAAMKWCTAKSENLNYTVKEEKRESVSEEGSSTWKQRKPFITEHLSEQKTFDEPKPTEEDPQTKIKWLTEEINHLQSLVQSYKNSKTKDEEEIAQLRAQCAAYADDLKKKQDEKKKMFGVNKELQKLNTELYTKLASVGIEQNACKQQQKSIVHSILQPYFTEGQIRCILEGRKWVKWSDDDFAAAISLRSVSPRAYRYLRNKLNYPLPALSSLRRWVSDNANNNPSNDLDGSCKTVMII